MKKISVTIFLVFFALDGYAQSYSSERKINSTKYPLETPMLREDRVIKKDDLSDEQTKYLWEGTTADRDGYIRVKSSISYIELLDAFISHPGFKKGESSEIPQDRKYSPLHLIGMLQEDEFRSSNVYYYGDEKAVFTIWRYKNAGATVTTEEEFFNQTVDGVPAILALAVSDGMRKALWKLSWWKNGRAFELYVNDKVDAYGTPEKTPKIIMELADSLL
ncbi:hypothetical protein H3H37_25010 [Duganella sp. LX20W]|uniref:Uncharacterized protein n=1 Tax=Rugamonas brunnea TaxID=2758569 RepID=A0A7W2EXE3_9BURK|nr:hypothetical protein [Rugamonas brunnea]MBA5640325.1 hypothetical protein [Rugamonas brunnea]